MSNLSFNHQELNFWVLKFSPNSILVGSDLFEGTITVSDDEFEQFLLEMDKIGTFFNYNTEHDETYKYKEFMKDTDLGQIDDLLDEYLKDKISQMDANEYETFTANLRSSDMYDAIPFPTEAQAAAAAGSQRVSCWEDLQEEKKAI